MATTYRFFIIIVVIQLFYAVGVTIISHGLTGMSVDQNTLLPYESQVADTGDVTSKIEDTTGKLLGINMVDIGTLVFYTGNIVLDLILNFFTALPSIVVLLVSGFMQFFSVDTVYAMQVKMFLFVAISVVYILQIIAFVMQLRGQGSKIT